MTILGVIEMRKLVVVVIFLLLYGCSTPDRVVEYASPIQRTLEKKSADVKSFFMNGQVKPISISEKQKFYAINEWYDQNTLLYSTSDNGVSSLYLHNINTGQHNLFYQGDEFIVKMEANTAYSLFALQTFDKSGISHLRILNKMGKEIFSISDKMEDLQFIWNPYQADELIVTEFLPYLEFQLFHINVTNKEINKIQIDNPYVQWTNKDQIGYLDWNQNEPSFKAPLILFNINTSKAKKWLDDSIMFLSFEDLLVTISVDPKNIEKSLYTFYEAASGEKLKEVVVPVLNTFSESWWIPNHDYDSKGKLFYYLAPYRSGNLTEYKEGFKLSVLSLVEDKEEVIKVIPNNVPIRLSPDGAWLLFGQQLEQILDVSNNKVYNLVNTK